MNVKLLTQPKETVLLTLTSSLPSEAAPAAPIVVVTPDDWTTTQAISIASIDDPVTDGDRSFQVSLSTLFSADPDYGACGLFACSSVCLFRWFARPPDGAACCWRCLFVWSSCTPAWCGEAPRPQRPKPRINARARARSIDRSIDRPARQARPGRTATARSGS